MRFLKTLFDKNRAWVESVTRDDPAFFNRLAHQQSPDYLWIGCSDSRVPANQIIGLLPGEVFVHRNVANVVVHTDLNCLSVIEFAIDLLKVSHIIVCGHYGCSGVQAALERRKVGLSDNWLRHVQDVGERHGAYLGSLVSQARRYDALCELNVIEQVRNVIQTTTVQDAWARGQPLTVHGWLYGVSDGLLRDLDVTVADANEAEPLLKAALEKLKERKERA
ncbi:MAG: carbonate dehydratase [Burkholderiales bacterium]|jgi:carbonic anhydrase